MANKRVSELAPIVAADLDFADLLLLSDISAHESKRVALQDLSKFLLLDGNLSGSLYGTASYALNAASASYYPPQGSASYSNTSSWAYNVVTASSSQTSLSSSYSYNSSFAITASYALTSSVEMVYSSAFADSAKTASYLVFTPGIPNGTASFALTASCVLQTQVSTSYAATASLVTTSSYANTASRAALADNASSADSANFLAYSANNGTASYAMMAGGFTPILRNYGLYYPDVTQSYYAQIVYVSVNPSDGVSSTSQYECVGNAVLNFSASDLRAGTISFNALNRFHGTTTVLDSAPIALNLFASPPISGTVQVPFTLMGQTYPVSDFLLYLTSSSPYLTIDGTRKPTFKINSYSDQLQVASSYENMVFSVYPTSSIFNITSSLGNRTGSMYDVAALTASNIFELDMSGDNINEVRYTWTLNNLNSFKCYNNPSLSSLKYGFAHSLEVLDCSNCVLGSIADLDNTSLVNFSCSFNNLFSLPLLPSTLTSLYADWNRITDVGTLPNSIATMSLANNGASLNLSTLPSGLVWVSFGGSSIGTLPTVPTSCSNLNFNGCSLTSDMIDSLCLNLVNNGQSNGTLDIRNNVVPSSTAFGYIVQLSKVGWTVYNDQ